MTNWSVIKVADTYTDLNLDTVDNLDFDVTITDPPYSRHCQENQTSGTAVKERGKKGAIPMIKLPFEHLRNHQFANNLVRVTKRWVLIFCTLEDVGRFADHAPEFFVRGGVWYKPNAMGQITKDRPATAYEAIAILHREGPKVWNGRGSFGIWKCNGTRGKKGRHPSEKPVSLLLKLTALFSNRGETVFDPFAGSGAVGEASKRLGRGYVGWERDASWVHKANARLRASCIETTDEESMKLCRMKG
jgi:site-specific DNA-methyltransferase (adenine-specific)